LTWFVYIIQSEPSGTLYTGIALDPDDRLRKHNGVLKGGAKATRAGRPWLIVYLESCEDKSAALRREAAIKKLSREEKLTLVEEHGLRAPEVE
jgi:putative endonuclease